MSRLSVMQSVPSGLLPAAPDDPNDLGRAGGPRFGPNDPQPLGAVYVAVSNR